MTKNEGAPPFGAPNLRRAVVATDSRRKSHGEALKAMASRRGSQGEGLPLTRSNTVKEGRN